MSKPAPDLALINRAGASLAQRLVARRTETARAQAEAQVDIVGWIESEFYIEELGGPIILYPYQREALREALRRNADGAFIYDLVLWSDIAKSAKSTIAAAVMLARAFHKPYGKFRVVANDQKQAMSRVFEYMKIALRLNKRLATRATVNRLLITLDNGATIEAVAVDPKGEAGGADDMVEFTELHAAKNDAAIKMWTETKLSPLKFGYAQRWIDTYAGYTGESPILEPLYEQTVKDGQKLRDDLPLYGAGRSFALWNTTPRLPWQTKEYYDSEERTLIPSEYRRIHRNEWVSSQQSFIDIGWWDACVESTMLEIDRFREVVISMDAAVSNDSFGIVALSRTGDKTYLRYCRRWLPDNGVIRYRNQADPTDRDYPEGVLRWLCNFYNVIVVAYDPYQLHSFVTGLRDEGLVKFEQFNQDRPRAIADKALYDNIRDRLIVHDGTFADMREHLANANSTAEDKSTLRIVKRQQTSKIDLAVALSMANDRARHYLPG